MKSYTYQEIVERFGEEIADKAISTGAEPTSRYIYPAFDPQHVGLKEWAEAPSIELIRLCDSYNCQLIANILNKKK